MTKKQQAYVKAWWDIFLARKSTDMFPNQDLTGKVIVFTGGTDGMGRVAVSRFAEIGATICLFGRNREKTQGVVDSLEKQGYNGDFSMIQCDLSSLAQVRAAAEKVVTKFPRIDYLINCAGVNFGERKVSPEGYEMNFAVNYLGPSFLTDLLLDRIKSSSGKIVNLVSATQEFGGLDFEDKFQCEKSWSLLKSYAQAKLCFIIYGQDLAKRLEGSDVTVLSLNPGYIKSNLDRSTKGFDKLFTQLFGWLAAPTWVGGERIVMATLDDQYLTQSGKFIYEDMVIDPNPLAMDQSNVDKVMELTRELTKDA